MAIGTMLIASIFDAMVANDTHQRTIRRLYCESGPAGRKAVEYVRPKTREVLIDLAKKCSGVSQYNITKRTKIMVLDTIADTGNKELLAETVASMDDARSKYAIHCKQRTQDMMRSMGF